MIEEAKDAERLGRDPLVTLTKHSETLTQARTRLSLMGKSLITGKNETVDPASMLTLNERNRFESSLQLIQDVVKWTVAHERDTIAGEMHWGEFLDAASSGQSYDDIEAVRLVIGDALTRTIHCRILPATWEPNEIVEAGCDTLLFLLTNTTVFMNNNAIETMNAAVNACQPPTPDVYLTKWRVPLESS